ncbi:MAG: site-2 protease family protein, partial [bacterium]
LIFLFVVSVHEYFHAWLAARCGEPTARLLGRMPLDPRSHIDFLGTILIPLSPLLFGLLGGGIRFPGGFRFFGWAKPVPVNPVKVRRWRVDNMLVSVAGCASGFLIALVAALILRVLTIVLRGEIMSAAALVNILWRMGSISIWLSLFNLIPIPPLDGYQLVFYGLGGNMSRRSASLERLGPLLLIFLINTPLFYAVLGPINAILISGLFRPIAGF